jgi:hypothetical protein
MDDLEKATLSIGNQISRNYTNLNLPEQPFTTPQKQSNVDIPYF